MSQGSYTHVPLLPNKSLDAPPKPRLQIKVQKQGLQDNTDVSDYLSIKNGFLKVQLGQVITLVCVENVLGKDSSLNTKITFKKDGEGIGFSMDHPNSLTFPVATGQTAGVYQCEAQNKVGKSLSNEITLQTLCKFIKR